MTVHGLHIAVAPWMWSVVRTGDACIVVTSQKSAADPARKGRLVMERCEMPGQNTDVEHRSWCPAEEQPARWLLAGHPTGFWYVFWAELAERASFWGMRVLLSLYLVEMLGFSEANAGSVAQLFNAACYLTPILGGFIADHYLGRYRTIIWFCVPYLVGHLCFGFFRGEVALFLGLLLIALGSGAIKPNTSTLMGLMYERLGRRHLLDEAFVYYYAAINLGATITSLAVPIVQSSHGYGPALMIPTGLIALSMLIFWRGRRYFPTENIVVRPFSASRPQWQEERAVLLRLAGILTLVAIYWFLADQSSSTWVFLANDHMDLTLWPTGLALTAAQTQALNPLMILLFTPLLRPIWRRMEALRGRQLGPADKMTVGFVLTVLAMAVMALAGHVAESGKASVWFLVLATLLITLAELCISAIGLQLCYLAAPASMKSQVMAWFLLTSFFGDSAGAAFTQLYGTVGNASYFALQALIATGAVAGMAWIAAGLGIRR
ncbi:peptide MFS transporter [Roseomonas frigidaquae]|uniref:Peptide MFS transporter n=1 Tax=Falsiroseomonas frigidaquae TaxID=487318 RepID=A0ABX1ETC8_9PROT|nr:peptide MFS transporter [Falsiroseomonas frigidaquae]